MSAQPLLLYAALRAHARRLLAAGVHVDLIDAHYVYPDGVAAGLLARELRRAARRHRARHRPQPDPALRVPRRMIRWAVGRAAGLVAVCEALARGLPRPRRAARQGARRCATASTSTSSAGRPRRGAGRSAEAIDPAVAVGQLIERKGRTCASGRCPQLPEAMLLVAGDGPLRPSSRAWRGSWAWPTGCASPAKCRTRRCPSSTAPPTRSSWPRAAKAGRTCCWRRWPAARRSSRHRSGACRRRSRRRKPGVLLDARTPEAIADAWRRLRAPPRRAPRLRRYAERFGWEATTRGQLDLFREVLAERAIGEAGGVKR